MFAVNVFCTKRNIENPFVAKGLSRGRVKNTIPCRGWFKSGSRKMSIVVGHVDARAAIPQSPDTVLAWIWEIHSAAVNVGTDSCNPCFELLELLDFHSDDI